MGFIFKIFTLPLRIVITVFIWVCALLIKISGKLLGIVAGFLFLMAMLVSTFSTQDALLLAAMAFLISPIGLPMIAVGLLSILAKIRNVRKR